MSTKNWQQKLNFHLLLLTETKRQSGIIVYMLFSLLAEKNRKAENIFGCGYCCESAKLYAES